MIHSSLSASDFRPIAKVIAGVLWVLKFGAHKKRVRERQERHSRKIKLEAKS